MKYVKPSYWKKKNFADSTVHNKIIAAQEVWMHFGERQNQLQSCLLQHIVCRNSTHLHKLLPLHPDGRKPLFFDKFLVLQFLPMHLFAFQVDSIGIGRCLPKFTSQICIVFFKHNNICSYFQGLQAGCIGALPEELDTGFSTTFLCH